MWVLDHVTSLLPAVPGLSPLAKELLSWGKCGELEMSPPSAAVAVLAASPGPVGEWDPQWPSPPCTEEQTGLSKAGGDDPQTAESGGPGRPRSHGDQARWSSRRGSVSHCAVPYAVTIKE